MDLDRRTCDRARRSRDPRFDGRFFIGVTSTRVYCRPICPVRAPKDDHIRYFPTAAAAATAGYRPCLRCRPEASPGTPAWLGTSVTVSRGVRLIGEGALDDQGVEPLANRLGVTARHLRRLFLQHLGATPLEVALTRRVHFAKKLLDETTLPLPQVALASGFRSLRRFNDHVRLTYERTPTELRRRARRRADSDVEGYRLRLAYRPPYDWDAMLAFLAARATPGVEIVVDGSYRRTIRVGTAAGIIDVSSLVPEAALLLDVRVPDPHTLLSIVERVRRVFDLGADPTVITEHLGADRLIRPLIERHPGLRAPGAWDGFELAVRAVLGQQVSVRAATTMAGRLASRWGTPVPGSIGRLFPTAAQLMAAPLERAGVVPSRAETIRTLARRVVDGSLTLAPSGDPRPTLAALRSVPGIGNWTAEYIAMRALGEPDAFPSGDLVLRRAAGGLSTRALDRRSEVWRPWRAYAVMLLWQGAVDDRGDQGRIRAGSRLRVRSTARTITAGFRPPSST
jgi:AraC family transcriptional regulator of adaptative response / DNA-3-methyladenine glycosylase II